MIKQLGMAVLILTLAGCGTVRSVYQLRFRKRDKQVVQDIEELLTEKLRNLPEDDDITRRYGKPSRVAYPKTVYPFGIYLATFRFGLRSGSAGFASAENPKHCCRAYCSRRRSCEGDGKQREHTGRLDPIAVEGVCDHYRRHPQEGPPSLAAQVEPL